MERNIRNLGTAQMLSNKCYYVRETLRTHNHYSLLSKPLYLRISSVEYWVPIARIHWG